MTHEEILAFLDNMPTTADKRIAYAHSVLAQVFGWVAMPDKFWLCEFLPDIRKEFNHRMHILEIGTFDGGSSRGLIALTGGIFSGIDNWANLPGGAQTFWETLRHPPDLSEHVKNLITGNSQDVGQTWNEPIDLVLIDADHQYETSISDMRLFCPWIIKGGYALCDDYNESTVSHACGEYFNSSEWETIRIPDLNTTAKMACYRKR